MRLAYNNIFEAITGDSDEAARLRRWTDDRIASRDLIPAGAMRVGPGTDAVVWRICPGHEAEL